MDDEIKQNISCPKCGAEYRVSWISDEWGELDLTPNFCPHCGSPIDELYDDYETEDL
jgi:ribosomal protein S27AE